MSQICTFFVPIIDGGESQNELNAFLRGHRVLSIEKAFAGDGWAFCIEWLESASSQVGNVTAKSRRIDYREVLDEETFARFVKLREKRKLVAQEFGVPVYMIMTDAQMATAVKDGEPTLEVLRNISGFGEARLEKYGKLLLCDNESLNKQPQQQSKERMTT